MKKAVTHAAVPLGAHPETGGEFMTTAEQFLEFFKQARGLEEASALRRALEREALRVEKIEGVRESYFFEDRSSFHLETETNGPQWIDLLPR